MKLALRWIPTEVWVDVFIFPWITRQELGPIVDRFKNRYIVEILQYCLHDRGKRTLKDVLLHEALMMRSIPQTPLPENIKSFECIQISHFDSDTLDFLRNISGLFINDVNLCFDEFSLDNAEPNLRTTLGHLTPLLHGIHSLTFYHRLIPLMEEYFGSKLAQIKMLTIRCGYFASTDQTPCLNFGLNWLTSEGRDQTEPGFLRVSFDSKFFQQFCMAIQQQFRSAKSPCKFGLELICYGPNDVADTSFQMDLQNNIGERLHGQFDEQKCFRIYRHPVDFPRSKLEEWAEKRDGNNSNFMWIDGGLTIGSIDSSDDDNEVDDAEEEADQPSTSG